MPDVDEVPVIGEQYQGAGIVTDIDESVQETPTSAMIWNRKVITTDKGAIFTLDHYIEKQQTTKNHQDSPATPKKSPWSEKKTAAANIPIAAAAAAAANSVDNSSVPLTITVYSKNDPDLPPPPPPGSLEPEPVRGIWTFGDGSSGDSKDDDDGNAGDEEEDALFWKPQQVLLYRPGLATIPEEVSLPSGVWGYAEDQDPNFNNSNSFSSLRAADFMNNDDPEGWHPKGCALVVPPEFKVPDNFVAAGRYTYKPDSVSAITATSSTATSTTDSWPPPIDTIKKRLHGVGKLKIPKCFEENDGKLPIKVFPRSKAKLIPAMLQEHARNDSQPTMPKRSVTFASSPPPVGEWSYPEGQEENDDHFMPVDVDLYWGNDKPAASVSGAMSDEGSIVSWGVWGSQGSVDLDDPEWEPEMSMVFPPGMEPDPEIAIQGRWAYRMNQNVKIEWPPTVTKTAMVYPPKDAPDVVRGMSQGVWEFPQGANDADEQDWAPLEVEIVGEDDSLGGEEDEIDGDDSNSTRPNGVWGIRQGAEPDRNWDWLPSDVLFFPPKVKPSDTTWVQGRWAAKRSVGKLKTPWPPGSASVKANPTVGRLRSFQWPKQAWVYPTQSVPPLKEGKTLGVWKFSGGVEPEDAASWKPQQVDLYGPTDKLDGTKPSGSWGVNIDASGTTTDSHFEPEDVWFYPPGQVPGSRCSVQGKWAFQRSKLELAWPPPKVSPAVQTRKSVGKLKIPGAFESEASPKVGPRRLTAGDAKLPSLFSNHI